MKPTSCVAQATRRPYNRTGRRSQHIAAVPWVGMLLVAFSSSASACPPGQTYCLLSDIGGCGALPGLLAANQPSWPITLVVDQQCGPYAGTLTLPGRMTLAGVGRDGEGALLFSGLPGVTPALAIAAGQGHVQVRDLLVRNTGALLSGIGLRLDGNSMVTLNGVRIDRFRTGIQGAWSFSVLVNQSNVSNNGTNLHLGSNANTWRVRDSVLSRALGWSVVVQGPNNDVLFDGNRLESNAGGGFNLSALGTVLSNNRLEFNGAAAAWHGIRVNPAAQQTRMLHNIFSTDVIFDAGGASRCAFNINVVEPASCL